MLMFFFMSSQPGWLPQVVFEIRFILHVFDKQRDMKDEGRKEHSSASLGAVSTQDICIPLSTWRVKNSTDWFTEKKSTDLVPQRPRL